MESFTIPFLLAADYVNKTNRNIFLTGKAGTGKTTFLREIKRRTQKQTAVVAPTGVAAINAGGSTIHSFFQLPFSPYLPEKVNNLAGQFVVGKNDLISRVKLNGKRRATLRELELLIIDEVSMVRCDTIDAIDVLLRHFRFRPDEPFGGVQLLLIGDMFQLSPVAVPHDWNNLAAFYQSPYFFHSRAIMQQAPVYIELDKIYRQKNDDFIKVLNEVRNNTLSPEGYQLLENRYQPQFIPEKTHNYITLSTHNRISDRINEKELQILPGKVLNFQATIKGDYPEKSYPIEFNLELKIGAKVMFIKNDPEQEKRYYNGKIGTLVSVDQGNIQVLCAGDAEPITVNQHVWENVKYETDSSTNQLRENVLGTFQQFPLRLAWAITIHKSQGLTFEKAIIDAGEAFAPGQVYVALSRCTSLEGLILLSPIKPGSLSNDRHIVQHSRDRPTIEEVNKQLSNEKRHFQRLLLIQCFDFEKILKAVTSLDEFVRSEVIAFNPEAVSFLSDIKRNVTELQATSRKFQNQLQRYELESDSIAGDLQERITAASAYFVERLAPLIQTVSQPVPETDSKAKAETYNEGIKGIFIDLTSKMHILKGVGEAFSVEEYYKCRKNYVVPPFSVDAYSGKRITSNKETSESARPALLNMLKISRNELCADRNIPVYIVASNSALHELAEYLPTNMNDLAKISGFGPAKIEKYGTHFLSIINDYCDKHNLETRIHLKASKNKLPKKESISKLVKVDTKHITFQHFQTGKSVKEIAKIRNFTLGTIQSHLAHYVLLGELRLEELIRSDKISEIESVLSNHPEDNISALKMKLGPNYEYHEIRLVSTLLRAKNMY